MVYSTAFQASGSTDDLITQIVTLPQTTQNEALLVASEYEAQVEALGRDARPRGADTYIWSNDPAANKRAGRWWFANVKNGNIPTDGSHYIRQASGTSRGWTIDVSFEGDTIIIAIFNSWSKSLHVFGTLEASGFDTRNPTHASDGWILAKPEVDRISNAILVDLINRLEQRGSRL